MLNRLTPILIVALGSIIMTILMSLSSIISMRNIEAMGLYDFAPADYLRRIMLSLFISFLFLAINVFFNEVKIGKFRFNLLSAGGVLLFNSICFGLLIAAVLIAALNRTSSWYAEIGLADMKARVAVVTVLPNLIIVIASILIGAAFRFFRENYRIGIQNEKLKKESAEAKLANLKEQLNPHFLFNSFSTLNELIDESPDKAKHFVHHMSDLYRFVLRNEQADKVTLAEELDFTMNYYAMLKERFGTSLHCHFHISEALAKKKVLPMGVQMLIENAVKHNYFDEKEPLHIFIRTSERHVKVSNQINKRRTPESHGMGLYNLNQRYQLLADEEIAIRHAQNSFEVQIPLIA